MTRKNRNILPPSKDKRSKYTQDQKVQALLLLRENNYNFLKTSLHTGIPRATLRFWNQSYKGDLDNSTAIQQVQQKVEMDLVRLKTNYIQKYYSKYDELAGEAIKRALYLIKEENDMNKVVNVLKLVNELIDKLGNDKVDSDTHNQINFIQQTINNLNMQQ